MARKRSKKQKIKAARRRVEQLAVQSPPGAVTVTRARAQARPRSLVKSPGQRNTSFQLQESLLGFDLGLIRQDLIKTALVSAVIIAIVLALFMWL